MAIILKSAVTFLACLFGSISAFGAHADELRDLVASGIHKDIFLAEKSVSNGVPNADNTCFAHLNFKKPNGVKKMEMAWTGNCEDSWAHGAGTLTLLFDSVSIFSESFDSRTGSAMIDGVPMSTLRPDHFQILQSICKQAGIIYDNTAQMVVAKYPAFAKVNVWTIEQDVWLYQNNTEAWCDGNFSREAVVVKGEEAVAVVDSVLTNLDRYFKSAPINLFEFNKRYNKGIDKYNQEMKVRAAAAERDEKAARATRIAEQRAEMEGDDYLITNMADFLELMGPVKGVAALARGRKAVIGITNISFSSGHFVTRFTAKSTSSIDAQKDLEENFSWDGFLGAALDGGMMAGTVEIACSFDPDVDTDKLTGDKIIADVTLLALENGFISLSCIPN